jgi:periplasmic divalent cation tolerance protein
MAAGIRSGVKKRNARSDRRGGVWVTTCDVVVVLITFPDDGDVASFAGSLVDERLAACVTVSPVVESVYRWNGAVERARERQLMVKTTQARVLSRRRRVQELHPYETPEFLCLQVSGGDERYLAWVQQMAASVPSAPAVVVDPPPEAPPRW